MALYVFVVYYLLPCVLVAIGAFLLARVLRRRGATDDGWRELAALGATVAALVVWYSLAGQELVAEWSLEHDGHTVVLRGPQSAAERGYLRVWIVPTRARGTSRANRPVPDSFSLSSEGDVRIELPARDARIRVSRVVLGGREVEAHPCGGSEGPDGIFYAHGVDGFTCSQIPVGWEDDWVKRFRPRAASSRTSTPGAMDSPSQR